MNECDKCPEYKDYHCEKFCKVIRHTIADLEEYYKNSIPIEWINQRVKGLKIQLINADEDDVDLIWHLRDEIQTLTELIDYWKAEQEKQKCPEEA